MKIITVGDGQVGCYLTSLLIEREHKVTIIKVRSNRIEVLKRPLPHDMILQGNSAEPRVLGAAGIRRADVTAAVTDSGENNLAVSTLTCLGYGVRRVIDRANNSRNAWLLTPSMSVDAVVNQAGLMARLVAEEMSMGDMMALLKLHGGKYPLVERIVSPGPFIRGKLLHDIELLIECMLVAIVRDSNLLAPRGETMLQGDDKVVTTVRIGQLENMERILGAGV